MALRMQFSVAIFLLARLSSLSISWDARWWYCGGCDL